MRKTIYLFLLTFAPVYLNAQGAYFTYDEDFSSGRGGRAIVASNDGNIIVGFSKYFSNIYKKINMEGEVIWSTQVTDLIHEGNVLFEIFPMPGDGYYCLTQDAFIHLGEDGSLLSSIIYDPISLGFTDTTFDDYPGVNFTDAVFTGTAFHTIAKERKSIGVDSFICYYMLTEISMTGEINFSHLLETEWTAYPFDFCRLGYADGYDYIFNQQEILGDSYLVVDKMLSGDTIPEYSHYYPYKTTNGVLTTPDGFIGYGGGADNEEIFLMKRNNLGDTLWNMEYTLGFVEGFSLGIMDMIVLSGSNLLGLVEYEDMTGDYKYDRLLLFSPEGELIDISEPILSFYGPFWYPDVGNKNMELLSNDLIGFTGFDALDEDTAVGFVFLTDTLGLGCINCVWPGDANNSGLADMDDLLTLGITFGFTGPERTDADNLWYGHIAGVWLDTLPDGTNDKYADCNGDGIINSDDTTAIGLNYGAEHPIYALKTTGGGAEIYLDPAVDSLPLGFVEIPIMLDAGGGPVELSGVRFSISFEGEEIIDSTSMDISFEPCWIGSPGEILTMTKTFPEIKTIDAGITRTDHTNVTGSGQIGSLGIIVIDNIAGKIISSELTINVSNIRAIKNDGEEIPLSGSTYTFALSSAIPTENTQQFILYPNPVFDNAFTIISPDNDMIDHLIITDLTGRTVYSLDEKIISGETIKIPALEQGEYIAKIIAGAQLFTQKLFIIH
ncbi:MAG: T9SS type A sorting domain-containing protein [Chitinophagales bacterium]